MSKKINKISELGKSLGLKKEDLKNIDEEIANTSLGRILAVLRARARVTQSEISKKLGTDQSYISKIENIKNENMSVVAMMNYVQALGFEFTINVDKPKPLVNRIIDTYNNLVTLFRKLHKSQRPDPEITQSLAQFESDALRLAGSLIVNRKKKSNELKITTEPKILFDNTPIDSTNTKEELEATLG